MLGNAPVSAVLPVADTAQSKRFYEGILGLRTLFESEGTTYFEAGAGTHLMIYQRPGSAGEHTAASFQVDDLAAELDALAAKGVHPEHYDMPGIKTDERGIMAMEGMGRIAWIKDPDGNILALSEM